MKKYEILSKIRGQVIAIVRCSDPAASLKCADALIAGGIRIMEFTVTSPGAFDVLRELSRRDKNMLIGAGSVLDAPSAALAIHSGASFLVTPTVNAEVLSLANGYGIPVICGAATATEAHRAVCGGADVIKIFPASQFTYSVIRELKAPMPWLEIIPVGGVGPENIAQWKAAGAYAYAVGGKLTAGLKTGDFAAVTRAAEAAVAAARE